jgi:hypothetical protein
MFILFIIAGMILIFAIILLITRIQYIRNGVPVEATVVDFHVEESADSETADIIQPIFKFYTLSNEEILTTADRFGSDEGWQLGDNATIVYQHYNPRRAVLLTYWGSFGIVTVLFCIALILILIAGGYYWAQHFFNSLQ